MPLFRKYLPLPLGKGKGIQGIGLLNNLDSNNVETGISDAGEVLAYKQTVGNGYGVASSAIVPDAGSVNRMTFVQPLPRSPQPRQVLGYEQYISSADHSIRLGVSPEKGLDNCPVNIQRNSRIHVGDTVIGQRHM